LLVRHNSDVSDFIAFYTCCQRADGCTLGAAIPGNQTVWGSSQAKIRYLIGLVRKRSAATTLR
jgi:hypothetical protein